MARFDSVELDRKRLRNMCYKFLCSNFHKFSTANKIKISIEALKIYDKADNQSISQISQIVLVRDGQQQTIEHQDGKELLSVTSPSAPAPLELKRSPSKNLGDLLGDDEPKKDISSPETSDAQDVNNSGDSEDNPQESITDPEAQDSNGSSAPTVSG